MLSLIGIMYLLNSAMASPILEARQVASTTLTSQPSATPGAQSIQQIREIQEEFIKAAVNIDPQRVLFSSSGNALVSNEVLNKSIQSTAGGSTLLPGLEQFPGLERVDLNVDIGYLNPCSLNIPHHHQDANEFFTVLEGQILGGLILDPESSGIHRAAGNSNSTDSDSNSPVKVVTGNLETFQGILFPVNHTHWQFNPTCQTAAFIASFDHAGPGRTQLPSDFFSVPIDATLIAAVGGDVAMLDALRFDDFKNFIDSGFAAQIEECVERCQIPR